MDSILRKCLWKANLLDLDTRFGVFVLAIVVCMSFIFILESQIILYFQEVLWYSLNVVEDPRNNVIYFDNSLSSFACCSTKEHLFCDWHYSKLSHSKTTVKISTWYEKRKKKGNMMVFSIPKIKYLLLDWQIVL